MKAIKATLRLFKAVPVTSKRGKRDREILEKTIGRGYVFSPAVIHNYPDCGELIKLVEGLYGITPEKLNNSFHKSWRKIKEADVEQLVVEQLAHYLTTYGKECPLEYMAEKEWQWGVDNLAGKILTTGDFESDRIYDADYVYIPKEKLEIPDLDVDSIKLIVIKGYTKEELRGKLLGLLGSGIALAGDTIDDAVDIAEFVGLDGKDIDGIKNKEVRVRLYDSLSLVPENPTEFLRFVIYKATGDTLVIKNAAAIAKIKEAKDLGIAKLFKGYGEKYGLERLAEIFHRFKPLFLAFKTIPKLKPVVNRIRRLAVKHHKSLPEDYLNCVTHRISESKLDRERLVSELDRVNTFRKIRLAYALKFRTKDVDSILYRIRNGKGYATDFAFINKDAAKKTLGIVLDSIVGDIAPNVKGRKICIPDHIHYSLPATEKQFTGHFPSGTHVSVPSDMIVGIHWENADGDRIDLDLSSISSTREKTGWDGRFRTDEGDILFSGDMTDATKPAGATELFYVKRQAKEALILFVNYYNFVEETEVPFKIVVAREKATDFGRNYMVNPNNLVCVAHSKINQKQKILGLLVTTMNGCRFYFAEINIGNSITSSGSSGFAEHSRKWLFGFYEDAIDLKALLVKAGAEVVDDKEKADVDLSPENLEKDSILNLLHCRPQPPQF